MDSRKRQVLALALLCVLLVKRLEAQAVSIQDSLPTLVLDDEPSKPKAVDQAVSENVQNSSNPLEPTSNKEADKEAKLVPYSTNLEAGASPAGQSDAEKPSSPKEPAQATSEDPISESSTAARKEEATSQTATSETTTPLAVVEKSSEPNSAAVESSSSSNGSSTTVSTTTNDMSSSSSSSGSSSGEKDINVLLANKDDAENDLASPPQVQPVSAADSKPSEDKKVMDLDVPVDTVKPSNDDRLHYALGDKAAPEESKPTAETSPAASAADEVPAITKVEVLKPANSDEKPVASPIDTDSVIKEAEEKPVGKRIEYDDKTKSVVIESAVNGDSPAKKAESPVAEVEATNNKQDPDADDLSPPAAAPVETAATTTSESPKPKPETEVPAASSPAAPESSSVATTTSTTTTSTTAQPAKAAEKPESVPSISAVALGTALGAAVNPLLSKDKPLVSPASTAAPVAPAGSATTTSTTKAPTTVRKSSTDKWDRWTPTTSSTAAPPTRRRPILPSIRRRFRPYNRFSPFPWGGADSYSPAGDPDFFDSVTPKATTSTIRPKRRHQQSNGTRGDSSTTEQPASSKPPSPPPAASPSNDDEDELDKPEVDQPTTRRRNNGKENRRRYHHHHHHNHHKHLNGRRQHHSGPKQELPYPSERPAFGEPSPFELGGGHHSARPYSPGFNFFNSAAGSAGSGFDLLNPFSGWLDDVTKPKPPLGRPGVHNPPTYSGSPRPLGSRPVPVEGEYNGEEPHRPHRAPHRPNRHEEYDHEHDHHHDHDHDHHHHHDCHDHDYDHDHHQNNRPQRPPPQREPYRPAVGGDYETPGYGRRPNRPYNRRDQAELERNKEIESAEASPSLYNSRPVGSAMAGQPRRVPSIFSPFDSLFGALDDELFSLRSTFIDVPPKNQDSNHAFDAIVSSPKISLPGAALAAKEAEAAEKEVKPVAGHEGNSNSNGSSNNNNNHGKPETELVGVSNPENGDAVPELGSRESRHSVGVLANQQPCSFPGRGLICLFSHQPLIEFFRRL